MYVINRNVTIKYIPKSIDNQANKMIDHCMPLFLGLIPIKAKGIAWIAGLGAVGIGGVVLASNISPDVAHLVSSIGNFMGRMFFAVWAGVASLVNFIERFFMIFAGRSPVYNTGQSVNVEGTGAEPGNLVEVIIFSPTIQYIFYSMMAVATVLLIFFTIIKLIQNQYKEKGGGNPYTTVFRMVKGMTMFLFITAGVMVGLMVSGIVLDALASATSYGDREASLSGMAFQAKAANASRLLVPPGDEFGGAFHTNRWQWLTNPETTIHMRVGLIDNRVMAGQVVQGTTAIPIHNTGTQRHGRTVLRNHPVEELPHQRAERPDQPVFETYQVHIRRRNIFQSSHWWRRHYSAVEVDVNVWAWQHTGSELIFGTPTYQTSEIASFNTGIFHSQINPIWAAHPASPAERLTPGPNPTLLRQDNFPGDVRDIAQGVVQTIPGDDRGQFARRAFGMNFTNSAEHTFSTGSINYWADPITNTVVSIRDGWELIRHYYDHPHLLTYEGTAGVGHWWNWAAASRPDFTRPTPAMQASSHGNSAPSAAAPMSTNGTPTYFNYNVYRTMNMVVPWLDPSRIDDDIWFQTAGRTVEGVGEVFDEYRFEDQRTRFEHNVLFPAIDTYGRVGDLPPGIVNFPGSMSIPRAAGVERPSSVGGSYQWTEQGIHQIATWVLGEFSSRTPIHEVYLTRPHEDGVDWAVAGEIFGVMHYTNPHAVQYFFIFGEMSTFIGWLALFILIGVLLNFLFGLIQRVAELVILYVMSPLTIALYPFDDGNSFNNAFIRPFYRKTIAIFAPVVALNLFFTLIPIFQGIQFFPSSDGLSNIFANVFVMLALFAMLPAVRTQINSMMGADNIQDKGIRQTYKESLNATVGGVSKATANKISSKADMVGTYKGSKAMVGTAEKYATRASFFANQQARAMSESGITRTGRPGELKFTGLTDKGRKRYEELKAIAPGDRTQDEEKELRKFEKLEKKKVGEKLTKEEKEAFFEAHGKGAFGRTFFGRGSKFGDGDPGKGWRNLRDREGRRIAVMEDYEKKRDEDEKSKKAVMSEHSKQQFRAQGSYSSLKKATEDVASYKDKLKKTNLVDKDGNLDSNIGDAIAFMFSDQVNGGQGAIRKALLNNPQLASAFANALNTKDEESLKVAMQDPAFGKADITFKDGAAANIHGMRGVTSEQSKSILDNVEGIAMVAALAGQLATSQGIVKTAEKELGKVASSLGLGDDKVAMEKAKEYGRIMVEAFNSDAGLKKAIAEATKGLAEGDPEYEAKRIKAFNQYTNNNRDSEAVKLISAFEKANSIDRRKTFWGDAYKKHDERTYSNISTAASFETAKEMHNVMDKIGHEVTQKFFTDASWQNLYHQTNGDQKKMYAIFEEYLRTGGIGERAKQMEELYHFEAEKVQALARSTGKMKEDALKFAGTWGAILGNVAIKDGEVTIDGIAGSPMRGNSFESVMNQGAVMANMLADKFVEKHVKNGADGASHLETQQLTAANNIHGKAEAMLEEGRKAFEKVGGSLEKLSGQELVNAQTYANMKAAGGVNDKGSYDWYMAHKDEKQNQELLDGIKEAFTAAQNTHSKSLDEGLKTTLSQLSNTFTDFRGHLMNAVKHSNDRDNFDQILQMVRGRYAFEWGFMEGQ